MRKLLSILIIVFISVNLYGCFFSKYKYITVINESGSDLTIHNLYGYVESHIEIRVLVDEQIIIESVSTINGEALDVEVSIDDQRYTVNTGYILDYANVQVVFNDDLTISLRTRYGNTNTDLPTNIPLVMVSE